MSAEQTPLESAAERLDGAYLLGVGETPLAVSRSCYQPIHRNPLLLCQLKEEKEDAQARSMVILNNQWQGYAGDETGKTSSQVWKGMDQLNELAPCVIQSVRVQGKGKKLPGSTCLFSEADLFFTLLVQQGREDVIKTVVAPYAFGGEHYPVEQITFFRAS